MQTYIHTPTSLRVQLTATCLLMNYIALKAGIPARMHFTDHYLIDRVIADKDTGRPRPIHSLVFWVDELDGEPVSKTWSILSSKLAAHFEPYFKDKQYTHYDFVVVQIGEGFQKDWNVQPIKRPAPETKFT